MPTSERGARRPGLERPRLIAGLIRGALVVLCGVLLVLSPSPHPLVAAAVLLGVALVGLAATTVPATSTSARLATLLEAALWAAGALIQHSSHGALLPYLLAPALAGGLALGLEGVLLPVGIGAVTVLVGVPSLDSAQVRSDLASGTTQWLGLAMVVGLLGSWVHRLSTTADPGYVEAYQLLEQLRTLTRALPVGFDAGGLAEQLLRDLRRRLPQLRSGAVYTRSPGSLPSLRATTRGDRRSWRVDLSEDSVFTEAWSSQAVASVVVDREGSDASCLVVLPLVVANRTVGVVALDLPLTDRARIGALAGELAADLDHAALRLETAMLFDELRETATVEERRRLAREIHDGIAQDLAAFGYQLDGLARETLSEEQASELLAVRAELGRLVMELRSSIFELRTEVDQHGGLGAALSEYVRGIGASSHLTVHLSLDERPDRLPSDIEAELLRIAQEAVTNARKHAQATNLWVRCEIDPPCALLVVADDGIGPGEQREGSFGIDIMRERAARLRAELSVAERGGGGTVVTCRLGAPA